MESIRDCFHEIHVTDTGSTDGTLELLQDYTFENPANTTLFLHKFNWCNDFAAARNYSFSFSRADYLMWLDLDDVMDNRQAFIEWRDSILPVSDYWVATYHYGGIDDKGNSPCKFVRERVVKNNGNFSWKYFVHEGLVPKSFTQAQYALSWSVIHKRTAEDQSKDRSRNLLLFEGREQELCARMRYYYGKELFENGQPLKAYPQLLQAAKDKDLEPHDRIMALQFACAASMQCNQLDEAIHIAHQGLQLAPTRSEFHVFIADSLIKQGKLAEAIPFLSAAKSCFNPTDSVRADVIFNHADARGHYPRNQLARCYFHLNRPQEAKKILEEAMTLGPNLETAQLSEELSRIQENLVIRPLSEYEAVPEIVITCLPNVVKNWDEDTLKTVGLGGSETAVIHMARHLHEKTGLKIRVFNDRQGISEKENVSYEPISEMYQYFRAKAPLLHLAWRHNIRLTPAPTYLWCHDLGYLGAENAPQFDGVLALSEFHQNWLTHIVGIDKTKIIPTKNGIDPTRFQGIEEIEKVPRKIIYSSSPDRGLEQVLAVMDLVYNKHPGVELHIFYGLDNMRAMGKVQEVEHYEKLLSSRPYIRNHGNVTQAELTRHFAESCIWLYPTTFLETYCITAIEALCSGTYPVVRKYGALPDTLKMAEVAGMASVLDTQDPMVFAQEVSDALVGSWWRRVKVKPEIYSWESVAEDWCRLLPPLRDL